MEERDTEKCMQDARATIIDRYPRLTQIPYQQAGECPFRCLHYLRVVVAGVQAMAEFHGREDGQSTHRKGGTAPAHCRKEISASQ